MTTKNTADLLVELGTEELPPKALLSLRDAFANEVVKQLDEAGFAHGEVKTFAAPRRLAFRISDLATQQPDRVLEKRGPALAAAFDKDSQPTRALLGFAQGAGVSVDDLQRIETDKGTWLVAHINERGKPLTELLQAMLEQSLQKLPIPKRMHWGARRALFVRPAHWLVTLLDDQLVPLSLLDLDSGNQTYGHRFHHPEAISLNHARDYEGALEKAQVLADFERRRALIAEKSQALGQQEGGQTRMLPELLDEVTALVEWPQPLVGHFEERFLRVPQEALIATMESNQKYFPVLDAVGKLKNAFIFVSNIASHEPEKVIAGNEKVVRPRLSDAEFFFDQDSKKTLAEHAEPLTRMVFQQQLGTLADKAERVAQLADFIASELGGDGKLAAQAARLAKADLTTGMVGEFDNMQGIMGRYLATQEGLPQELATALEEQYLPRFAGDDLPATTCGRALALADKIDTLVGIFGIGAKPSGDKDPFALRRAALGVLRICIECALPLNLAKLIERATHQLGERIDAKQGSDALDFLIGRYRAFYQEQGFATALILAAVAVRPEQPLDLDSRLRALASFQQQPTCAALAAANKRVANILAKADKVAAEVDRKLLTENAEVALADALAAQSASGDYLARLESLAALREPVDAFFEQVMVNAEDAALRHNRLALLAQLRALFMDVADISLLD